jgi:hypothetical protein
MVRPMRVNSDQSMWAVMARSRPTISIEPPEPDLTPAALIARAAAMRPMLRARQAAY